MDRTLHIRAAALYAPICLALLAAKLRRQPPRQFAACLLSLLWALPALLALQRLNELAQWWSYASSGPMWRAMPLELYLGWAVLWGVVPQLSFPRLALWKCAAAMILADLIAMPLCTPVVLLAPRWLFGEAVAVVLVLVPALCIARWTVEATHLRRRAVAQAAISAAVFLFFVPEVAFALRPGRAWQPLTEISGFHRQLWLQIAFILALPGLSAVMEFALRGSGTPIPYDPPKRLVTSGIYRYVANPMQLSCVAVMLAWAAMLRNVWLLAPPLIAVVYSAGIAAWDEGEDLGRRFGQPWLFYRMSVRNWRPRWRPYHAGQQAKVYIASTCGPCSEVRAWIEARRPVGLVILAAETLPAGSVQRMLYDPADGSDTVEGVRAFARALEHLNLGWAIAGAAMRLPVAWQFIQLMLDAGGLGPRRLLAFGANLEAATLDPQDMQSSRPSEM